MQLSHESKHESVIPYNIPLTEAQQHESELVTQFGVAWKRREHKHCLTLLESLPAITLPLSITLLSRDILFPSFSHTHTKYNWFDYNRTLWDIQRRFVRLLGEVRGVEAIPSLIQTLFHESNEIADMAQGYLLSRGQEIVPYLLKEFPRTVVPSYWNEKGILRVINLLKQQGDKRASDTLLVVAFKNIPIKSSYFKIPLVTTLALLGFQTLVALAFAVTHLDIGTLWWYLVACGIEGLFLFLFFTFLCSPFIFISENDLKTRLSSVALQALAVIQDKTTLPQLITLAWNRMPLNPDAIKAFAPLLPLVTKEDTKLLTTSQEKLLAEALHKSHTELHSGILHVLECVGTEVSLQPLHRFVQRCKMPSLQARANGVYEAVKARADLISQSKVLLRASQTPDQHETLLRPSQERFDPQEVQELLQPVENPPTRGD